MELYYALDDNLEITIVQEMGDVELDIRCRETHHHVTARCACLLEVSEASKARDGQIQYLHRTVKDFLEEPSRWAAILNDTKAVFDPWWSMLRSKGLLAYQLLAEQAESVDERLEIICPEMLVCSMEIDQQSPYRLCRMDVLLMSTTCLSSMTTALTFSPYMEIGMIGWKVMTLPQAYAALYLPVH